MNNVGKTFPIHSISYFSVPGCIVWKFDLDGTRTWKQQVESIESNAYKILQVFILCFPLQV